MPDGEHTSLTAFQFLRKLAGTLAAFQTLFLGVSTSLLYGSVFPELVAGARRDATDRRVHQRSGSDRRRSRKHSARAFFRRDHAEQCQLRLRWRLRVGRGLAHHPARLQSSWRCYCVFTTRLLAWSGSTASILETPCKSPGGPRSVLFCRTRAISRFARREHPDG